MTATPIGGPRRGTYDPPPRPQETSSKQQSVYLTKFTYGRRHLALPLSVRIMKSKSFRLEFVIIDDKNI